MQMIKAIIFMIRCKYLLLKVKKNGEYLRKIKFDHWTFDICLAAVSQNGLVIQTINSQREKFTPEDYETLCLAAIKQNDQAFQYVVAPTERVCISAITKNEMLYYQCPRQREYFKFNALKYIIKNTSLEISINLNDNALTSSEIIELLLSVPEGNKQSIIIKKGKTSIINEIIRI